MTQEIITITVEAGQMTARRKTLKIAQHRPVPVWAIVKYAALTIAGIILISEVLDAVEEYEPRAEVTNVTFEAGETPGLLVPVLEVNIVDNEE